MNTQAQNARLSFLEQDSPGKDNEGTEVLAWNGRLDNRGDLLMRLRDSLGSDASDAALALAAWGRWGTDGLAHLIGDWSIVIRDLASRAIVLASDFAGVRPLYYNVQPGRVLWSASLESLMKSTNIEELDEKYIGGLLVFGGYPNHTPYKGIRSVPPGHAVCVSARETTIRRFWTLPVGDIVRYRSEDRYEEQLRSLFREAVSVRLQTDAPIVAELSGGLDSSSVVSMANQLMRSGAIEASRLTGLSYVWPDSLDEPFIREVESFCGIEALRFSTRENPLMAKTQAGGAMPRSFEPLHAAVGAAARRLGAKVFLTGQNGDLIMGNWFDDSLQVSAPLRHFRIGRACGESLAWSKILGLPIAWILWRAFRAVLPPAWAPAVYSRSDGSYVPENSATSLVPGISKRMDLADPASLFSNTWMQAPPERRKHFRAFSMTVELRALQVPEPLQCLDYTHPFAHRPLVEFLMSVPADVLCGPGEPRKLMRRALSDLWPPRLRTRRSKGLFDAPWQEALRPLARDLLKERQLELVERGFVDLGSVRARLERLAAGLECNASQLRQIMLLELWLRHRGLSRPSGAGVRAA